MYTGGAMLRGYNKTEKALFIMVGFLLMLVISYGIANHRNESHYQSCQKNIEEIQEQYNEW